MEVQRGQYSTRDSAAIDPHDGLEVNVEQLAVGTRQGLQWFAGVENFVMHGQTEVQATQTTIVSPPKYLYYTRAANTKKSGC